MNATISRENLLASLLTLSRSNQKWIADHLYENIGKPIQMVQTKKAIHKTHSGISPSNDPWFDDPRNLAYLDQVTEELKHGEWTTLDMEEVRKMFGL